MAKKTTQTKGRAGIKSKGVSEKRGKKQASRPKVQARIEAANKEKTAAKACKQDEPDEERENPVTVTVSGDGIYTFHGRSAQITKDKNSALVPYGKQVLNYGLQLLLLPQDWQAEQIRRTNGCARFVRRAYLEARQAYYKETKGTLSVSQYMKGAFKELKAWYPWLNDVDKFALAAAVENVDDAYRHFFNDGFGFPKNASKYKPNGNRYTTKQTNNNIRLIMAGGLPYVQLPKLGKVRFVMPAGTGFGSLCPRNTRITSATVIKDGNAYLVSLQMEAVIDRIHEVQEVGVSRILAADMGIKSFMDYGVPCGERVKVENKRWIKKHEKRLRRFQKALARKQYDRRKHRGSKNYYKAKDKVAREQRKVANQRKDFHHKLSRAIADSCDVFVCEDLNIKGMMKNRYLAKAVASVGWGGFLTMVQYKLERKGGIFLKVSRWFPSSKTCACCGYKKDDLMLNDRFWVCPSCHAVLDRDDNAVDNIGREGIRLLKERGVAVCGWSGGMSPLFGAMGRAIIPKPGPRKAVKPRLGGKALVAI